MEVGNQGVDKKVKDCLPVQHLAFLPMRQTKSFLLQAIFAHELFVLFSKMMKNNDLRIFHTKQKGYDV